MEITTDQVKRLRDETGVSVMECKRALAEAEGDHQKALDLLKKRGSLIAAKKANRALKAGVVQAYIHSSKDIGALVSIACETDFVAKNPEFSALAHDVAMQIAAANPKWITRSEASAADAAPDEVLFEQQFIKDPERTVGQLIDEAIQKFGERIEVVEATRFSLRN